MGKKGQKKAGNLKKKGKNEKNAKSSKSANAENQGVRCEICNKSFSKKANLNVHVAVSHKGRRYICTICEEDQTTKASYLRHMKRRHPEHPVENVSEKECYSEGKIQMTEKAKDALLERLSKELVNKNKTISNQKKTIANLKKEVTELTREIQSNQSNAQE